MSRNLSSTLSTHYGGRVRLRVMGLCLKDQQLLLLKHRGFGPLGHLWAPPGGEVEFGESLPRALLREFKEETGLTVEVDRLLFLNEHIEAPLHALECFFYVVYKGGSLRLGTENETTGTQILEEVRYFSISELKELSPGSIHTSLLHIDQFSSLLFPDNVYNFCISKENI